MTFEDVASAAYEANRRLCHSLGDHSQVPWNEASEWQRSSVLNGVQMLLAHPEAGPGDSHRSWLAEKEAAGWRYGLEKDVEAKLHPSMVPFDNLPLEQQMKDHLFVGVVRALLGQAPVPEGDKKPSAFERRFVYHPPTEGQAVRYECIRGMVGDVAEHFRTACPDSWELSLAITKLEEAVFWANAAIARNE